MDIIRRLVGLLSRKQVGPGGGNQPHPEPLEANAAQSAVGQVSEVDAIVRQICSEAALTKRPHEPVDLANSPRWTALLAEAPELLVAVAWAANRGPVDRNAPHYWQSLGDSRFRRAIFSHALRRKLPFKPEQLDALLNDWLEDGRTFDKGYSASVLLGAVERLAARQALPPEICGVLQTISERAHESSYRLGISTTEAAQVIHRIDRLLDPSLVEKKALPAGPFVDELGRWASTLTSEERAAWQELVFACSEFGDKPKPSGKWRDTAQQLIAKLGQEKLTPYLIALMDQTTTRFSLKQDDKSVDIMKGLVWATTLLNHSALAGEIGRFALSIGWTKLENAAFWALSEMPGEPRAAAELFRLRGQFKLQGIRKIIDKRLAELAEKSGATVDELEDLSLPLFDLDEASRLIVAFGDARVELVVGPNGITQQWTNADGKTVKGPPAEVRHEFAKNLTAYRKRAKDIEAARDFQVRRLEASWAEDRSWAFSDWQKHFHGHPLRCPIVSTLIWSINDKAVMPEADVLKDLRGNLCAFGSDDRVRLWHPVDSHPQQVLAWRARILDRGFTQPIKQAHREIYVLTDAERATRTYSNRFAGHVLRQHQFKALCEARGWRYKLMGEWDGFNVPTRVLSKQAMTVEYEVDMVEGGEVSSAHVALHLASDQVRFLDAQRQPVALEHIAPIAFSEVMRDVDLFVAVISVANDPNWADGGPEGRHGGYWREWAFSELGQSAATRKELITGIVPKLSIADKLEVTEKFLVVQGKRQKYAIHFGSSNIQILPSNRYLCIVPDRAPKETRDIKLPFAGDSLLSTILAKAFLLVDEDTITDETILRQL